jgi:hypothetical protein
MNVVSIQLRENASLGNGFARPGMRCRWRGGAVQRLGRQPRTLPSRIAIPWSLTTQILYNQLAAFPDET